MPSVGFEHACLLVSFIASAVFILGYSMLAPWWRYAVGRTVVSLDFGIMLALLPGMLRVWFGVRVTSAFFAWYYCFSLLLLAGITLWRLYAIYRLQQQGRNHHLHGEEE